MSRQSDTGNFLMLLIGAAFAGAFIGDWAFKTVLVIGMAVMAIGALVYVLKTLHIVLKALGINLNAPLQDTTTPGRAAGRTRRNPDRDVEALLRAVAAQDGPSIERLVLRHNVSPFQSAPWRGSLTNANDLALSAGCTEATTFFSEWRAKGSEARIPKKGS